MKALKTHSSGGVFEKGEEIEIDTLEQLIDLMKNEDNPLIISRATEDRFDFEIEVYDDYRE